MRVSHRLDVCLLAASPDRPLGDDSPWQPLIDRGVIQSDGRPGASATWLVAGGFERARLEKWDRAHLYSNRQGGFRVCCPTTRDNLIPSFHTAIRDWRAGGERSLNCPSCDEPHALEALDYQPAAGFGHFALIVGDAVSAGIQPEAQAWFAQRWGGLRTILQRVSA